MPRFDMTPARAVASALGLGLAPVAPGTVASAVACLLGAAMLTLSAWALVPAILLATGAGFWALRREPVADDPGWVVIDEVAGQWIALLAASTNPWHLLAAFVLFRIFDIVKPGPVGWADRQHGNFGLMADDLIAGALAAAILCMIRWLSGW